MSLVTETVCHSGLLECKENEECIQKDGEKQGICQCKKGWRQLPNGSCEKIIYKKKECEVGLLNCQENEECIPVNSRSRSGYCKCKTGYILESETCQKDLNLNNISNNVSNFPSTTLSSKVETSYKPTETITSTTDRPQTDAPEHPEKIIVNVNNKTIILPEGVTCYKEWVTLSAYAIGGKYLNYIIKCPKKLSDSFIRF